MSRTQTQLILACAVSLSLSGCVFIDDDHSEIRGYTECGTFLGGQECAPGQYCSAPEWSECANGCLSDVNCASNQYCAKSGGQVGVCENVRMSVVRALTLDGSGTSALDGSESGR